MNLPDFMIIGAQKCGTTSLHKYLSSHPQIFMPRRPQELHYFDFDENFQKGLLWYAEHFNEALPFQKIGQTSPLYIFLPECSERIFQSSHKTKFIAILRDPVERAYSHYLHQVKKGSETMGFCEAVALEAMRINQNLNSLRQFSYVNRGLYFKQLRRYRDLFTDDNVLVIQSEALRNDPKSVLNNCARFLEVRPFAFEEIERINNATYNRAQAPRSRRLSKFTSKIRGDHPYAAKALDLVNLRNVSKTQLSDDVRLMLVELLDEDVKNLANSTEIDLSLWRNFSE